LAQVNEDDTSQKTHAGYQREDKIPMYNILNELWNRLDQWESSVCNFIDQKLCEGLLMPAGNPIDNLHL
jgi:hypothetical protein